MQKQKQNVLILEAKGDLRIFGNSPKGVERNSFGDFSVLHWHGHTNFNVVWSGAHFQNPFPITKNCPPVVTAHKIHILSGCWLHIRPRGAIQEPKKILLL